MCQILYFSNFFCTLYFFQVFLLRRIFPIFSGAIFSKYFCFGVFSRLQRCSYVLSIVTFCFYSEPEIMRHCRSGIAASIYSGIAASIYSGIAANMHSQRHCRKAALPPTCIHTAALPPVCSGTAAMRHCRQYAAALPPCSVHSQRHCRQHAFTAAVPPACTLCGIAASKHSHAAALPPFCLACAAVPLHLNSCCNFG